jgi:hypothetical protein
VNVGRGSTVDEDALADALRAAGLAGAALDVTQTEPLPGVEPAPLEPPSEPVSGDSHAHLLPQLAQHAVTLGFNVEYEPLDGPAGYCSSRQARIVIDSALPGNGKVTTLVHELAHAHGIDYKNYSRPEAELIVESVACIVCGSVGLDTTSESVPYLAGWNDQQAAERIKLLAGTIDEIARAIERAIDGRDGSEETASGTFAGTTSETFESTSAVDSGQR